MSHGAAHFKCCSTTYFKPGKSLHDDKYSRHESTQTAQFSLINKYETKQSHSGEQILFEVRCRPQKRISRRSALMHTRLRLAKLQWRRQAQRRKWSRCRRRKTRCITRLINGGRSHDRNYNCYFENTTIDSWLSWTQYQCFNSLKE